MRILIAQPGADYSTHDVFRGLCAGFRALGHEVVEFDVGVRLTSAGAGLDALWRQSGLGLEHRPSLSDVMYEAGSAVYPLIVRERIDAVLIVTGDHWHPDHTMLLRRSNMPVGIIGTEAPYMDVPSIPFLGIADAVWTNERTSVDTLQEAFRLMELPAHCHYLPAACNPAVHSPAPAADEPSVPAHDVVFVGTGFEERCRLLEGVPWREQGIDFGLYGDWRLLVPKWAQRKGDGWTEIFPREPYRSALRLAGHAGALGVSPLWPFVHGGITPNKKTTALYRRAAIGLNLFRTSSSYRLGAPHIGGAESIGPRLYELAASGCFTLSEHRPEVVEVFGDAVPTFKSAGELAELVRHYLDRPLERHALAARLPGIVRDHGFEARAAQIMKEFGAVMRKRAAGRELGATVAGTAAA